MAEIGLLRPPVSVSANSSGSPLLGPVEMPALGRTNAAATMIDYDREGRSRQAFRFEEVRRRAYHLEALSG